MISQHQKIIADRQLGTMISIGFVSSTVLHLGLIAGISYWWKPSAPIDEALEITLVESVVEKVPSPPAPLPVALPPKPASQPKLTALKPIPIPTPIAIPPSIPVAVKPTPIATPAPQPIAIKSTPKPIPPKPATKPQQIAPKTIPNPIPPAIINPPFPADKFIPTDTPSAPTAFNPPTVSNPPKQRFSTSIPVKSKLTPTPNIPTTPSNFNPPLTKTASDPTENPSTGGNNSDRLAQQDRGNNRSTGGILASNGDRSNRANSDRNGQGNSTIPRQSSDPPAKASTNSPATTSNSNSNSGTGTGGRLQCVQNCQIAKLQDLQDSDGGKDRLRIRIVVDANGLLLSAEIAKSSGNPQIDSVVLAGVKQMSFNPTGKVIKGTIKANILL